jgi:pyruvate dehydrogenase E1 component alpha subunit
LVEAKTLRIRGHYEGDRQNYRDDITLGLDVPRDPIDLLRREVPADVADQLDDAAREEVETVLTLVLASPRADPSIIYKDVWT